MVPWQLRGVAVEYVCCVVGPVFRQGWYRYTWWVVGRGFLGGPGPMRGGCGWLGSLRAALVYVWRSLWRLHVALGGSWVAAGLFLVVSHQRVQSSCCSSRARVMAGGVAFGVVFEGRLRLSATRRLCLTECCWVCLSPFFPCCLAVRPITNGGPLGVRAAPQLSFSLESFGRGVRWRCSAPFLGHCCVVRCFVWLFGLVCRGLVLVCFNRVGVGGLVGFLLWVRQFVVSRLSALWSRVGCLCEASRGLVSLSLGLPGPTVGVCYVMLSLVAAQALPVSHKFGPIISRI